MSSHRKLVTGEAEDALLSRKAQKNAKYRLPCIPPGNQTVHAHTGHVVLTFGQVDWELKQQVIKSGFAPPANYQYRVRFPGERTKGHLVPEPTEKPEELAVVVKASEQELKAYLRELGNFKIGCEDASTGREVCLVSIDMMKTIGLRQQLINCNVSRKGMMVGRVNVGFKMVWNSDLEKGMRTLQRRRGSSAAAPTSMLRPMSGMLSGTRDEAVTNKHAALQSMPVGATRNPRLSTTPSKLPIPRRGSASPAQSPHGSAASIPYGGKSPEEAQSMRSAQFRKAGLSSIPSPPGRHTEHRCHSRREHMRASYKHAQLGSELPESSDAQPMVRMRSSHTTRQMKGVLSWDQPGSIKGPELSAADLSPNSGINIGALFVSITEALEAQKIRLLELFRRYDRDKSTSLNWSELGFLLVDLLPYPPTRMQHGYFMSMLDADGDGEVSYRDFAAVIRECKAAGMQVRAGEMTERRRLLARVALRILERQLDIARAWRKFADKANIQILDFEKLVRMLRYLLPDLTDKEDRKLMSCLYMLDRHNAGHISYQEFKYFLLKGAKRFLKSNKRQKWDDTMFILPSTLAGVDPLAEKENEEDEKTARQKQKELQAERHMLALKDEDLLNNAVSSDLHAPEGGSFSSSTGPAVLVDHSAILKAGAHERSLIVPELPRGVQPEAIQRSFQMIASAASSSEATQAVEHVKVIDDAATLRMMSIHHPAITINPEEAAALVTFKDREVRDRVAELSGAILIGSNEVSVYKVVEAPPKRDAFPTKFGGDVLVAIAHAAATGVDVQAAFDSLDTDGDGELKPPQLRRLLHLLLPAPAHEVTAAHEDYFLAVLGADRGGDKGEGASMAKIMGMAQGFASTQLALTRPGGFVSQDTDMDNSPLAADWMAELDDVDTYDLVHAEQKALEKALTGIALKLASHRRALEDGFQKRVAVQHRVGGPKRGARVVIPHASAMSSVLQVMGDSLTAAEVPLVGSLLRHASTHPEGITFPEFKAALDIAQPKPENVFPDKFGGDIVVAIAHAVDKDGVDVAALWEEHDTEGTGELNATQLRKLLHSILPAPHKVLAAHEDYFLTMMNVASDKMGPGQAAPGRKTLTYAEMMRTARLCCRARIAVSRPDGILTMDADAAEEGEGEDTPGRTERDAHWIADYEDDKETYDDMMREQEALGKVLMDIAMKVADARKPLEDAFRDAAAGRTLKGPGGSAGHPSKGHVTFAEAIRLVRNVLGNDLTREEEHHIAALLRFSTDDKKGINMAEFQAAFKTALNAATNYNAVFSEQTDVEIQRQRGLRNLFEELWPQFLDHINLEGEDPEAAARANLGWPMCLVFQAQIKAAVKTEKERRLESAKYERLGTMQATDALYGLDSVEIAPPPSPPRITEDSEGEQAAASPRQTPTRPPNGTVQPPDVSPINMGSPGMESTGDAELDLPGL